MLTCDKTSHTEDGTWVLTQGSDRLHWVKDLAHSHPQSILPTHDHSWSIASLFVFTCILPHQDERGCIIVIFFSKKNHQELPHPPLKCDYGSVIKRTYISNRNIKLSFKHLTPTAHNHCNSSPMGSSTPFPASPSLPGPPYLQSKIGSLNAQCRLTVIWSLFLFLSFSNTHKLSPLLCQLSAVTFKSAPGWASVLSLLAVMPHLPVCFGWYKEMHRYPVSWLNVENWM